MNAGAGRSSSSPGPVVVAAAAPPRATASSGTPPPENTGTHWTGPNEYLLAAASRANVFTLNVLNLKRHPLGENAQTLAVQLQRYVHHEGNRPPNRLILLHLRLLTYYPPEPDILPELVTLLASENPHICRLAHYHIRQIAPIRDHSLYRDVVEALEREVVRPSPARRAAATKTLAKIFIPADASRAMDFVADVFKCIGGVRVKDPNEHIQQRKVAGIKIPGTDISEKPSAPPDEKKKTKKRIQLPVLRGQVVTGETEEDPNERGEYVDDGAGGVMLDPRGSAPYVKSRFGKMLVSHAVFAALRRINRIAAESCRVDAYFFDSGLMSVVPSTVRHSMALLEIRSRQSPRSVAKYISLRLPHKNPPAHRKIQLDDLGAKIYFARMLGDLAEDPNLVAHIPEEAPAQARRTAGIAAAAAAFRTQALAGDTIKQKASNIFKFLFNRDRIADISSSVRSTSTAVVSSIGLGTRNAKPEDPLGVEFAEALVNLIKNASNRVLLEALRGLSHRRWTTWCEAPIPQSALYSSPELEDPSAFEESSKWGLEEEDSEDDESGGFADKRRNGGRRGDDDDELGAYEDDIANQSDSLTGTDKAGEPVSNANDAKGRASMPDDGLDPDLDDINGPEKGNWITRMTTKRRERREAVIGMSTPFYLRKLGQGMVPTLEVILRRIYRALLHDESVRRFAAVDSVIVLARAMLYGYSPDEHVKLRKAQTAIQRGGSGTGLFSSSSALVTTVNSGSVFSDIDAQGPHAFEALVRPLKEIVDEDPNQYVRGRAAVALMFIVAAGAGRRFGQDLETSRKTRDSDRLLESDLDCFGATSNSSQLLVRYFGGFVAHDGAGRGIGLRLVSEVMDYLVYELLDQAPELAAAGVTLAELWAVTHPTVGVCGRLGAVWEKVLSIGGGEPVGLSITRVMSLKPHAERVASAAAAFLRRRTLDLAVITVGSSHLAGQAVPEPLPEAIRLEMEKYFSLLWHSALLGPSAECRTLSVEALGGAAALAGDPLRVCTYERLVELVRVRGLGLKIPAENVMDAIDVLYSTRERFSEARHVNRIARDGTDRSRDWLELVWRLAAEASSACQILLGVPPPTGWQPLGPSGAADVANAETAFGDVRDRQEAEKLRDSSIALQAAPTDTTMLSIESRSSVYAPVAYAPEGFDRISRSSRYSDGMDEDVPHHAGVDGDDRYRGDARRRTTSWERRSPRRHDSDLSDEVEARGDRGYRESNDIDDREDQRKYGGDSSRLPSGEVGRRNTSGAAGAASGMMTSVQAFGKRATDAINRKDQEIRDRQAAGRAQREQGNSNDTSKRKPLMDDLAQVASFAPLASSRFFRGTMKTGGEIANKAGKLAKSIGGGKSGPP